MMNDHEIASMLLKDLGISFDTKEQNDTALTFVTFQLHMLKVFCRKNRQYGNSFEEVGAKGAYIEIQAKHARLRELLWRADEESIAHNHGDIQQNSLDLSVYGVLLCMCIAAGNVYGVDGNG